MKTRRKTFGVFRDALDYREFNFAKIFALGIVGAGQNALFGSVADEWSDSGTPKSPTTYGWERPKKVKN
ncbi:MAG: hypothetical protein R3Y36_07965 [Spirochaetales bacterium]